MHSVGSCLPSERQRSCTEAHFGGRLLGAGLAKKTLAKKAPAVAITSCSNIQIRSPRSGIGRVMTTGAGAIAGDVAEAVIGWSSMRFPIA